MDNGMKRDDELATNDNLAARLELLKKYNVSHYKDGTLEIRIAEERVGQEAESLDVLARRLREGLGR